jgi:hypothetical protein
MDSMAVTNETADDDDLPLSILHQRDSIIINGKMDQDYRFLSYRFAAENGEIEARAYLDDIWEVSIIAPIDIPVLPTDVMAYLQKRFNVIKKLGGPEGYRIMWEKTPPSAAG